MQEQSVYSFSLPSSGFVPSHKEQLAQQIKRGSFSVGETLRDISGQHLGTCVANLTDFAYPITLAHAVEMMLDQPCWISFNPKAKESDMDPMRYRGYAWRKAILSSGVVFDQLLIKSFGEPVWINLPAGAELKKA